MKYLLFYPFLMYEFSSWKNVKAQDFRNEISGTMSLVTGLCASGLVSESRSYMSTCFDDIEQLGTNNIEGFTY